MLKSNLNSAAIVSLAPVKTGLGSTPQSRGSTGIPGSEYETMIVRHLS